MFDAQLSELSGIKGFQGACVVDRDMGLPLMVKGHIGPDIDKAARALSEVLRVQARAQSLSGVTGEVEEIVMTLGTQFHMLWPLHGIEDVFVYLVLNRKTGSIVEARKRLALFDQALVAA